MCTSNAGEASPGYIVELNDDGNPDNRVASGTVDGMVGPRWDARECASRIDHKLGFTKRIGAQGVGAP